MNGEEKEALVSRLSKTAGEVRQSILSMIHKAQSGHPGGSLSVTDVMTVLYFHFMNIDPKHPDWSERDRFVLSKGHACPAWYACLGLRGYFPAEHFQTLRRMDSILQGHPDMKKTPGVDMTTGSLGLGFAASLGMALEGKMKKSAYRVFGILGDGELNEGVVWETVQAASKFKLDNFYAVIDLNGLQLDGPTEEIMPLHPLKEKFEAFGWHVLEVDGHSIPALLDTFEEAFKVEGKPVCIIADTVKGKGVSFMENQLGWHGKAPNDEEFQTAMAEVKRA